VCEWSAGDTLSPNLVRDFPSRPAEPFLRMSNYGFKDHAYVPRNSFRLGTWTEHKYSNGLGFCAYTRGLPSGSCVPPVWTAQADRDGAIPSGVTTHPDSPWRTHR